MTVKLEMTPDEFRRARTKLGYSARQMAEALRVSDGRTIRRWEAGDRPIPGPVIVCLEFFLAAIKKKPK